MLNVFISPQLQRNAIFPLVNTLLQGKYFGDMAILAQ